MSDDDALTSEDVAELNRDLMVGTARLARFASGVMIVVGLVGVAAWAWFEIRTQQRTGPFSFSFGSDGSGGISAAERVDLFATTFGQLVAAVLVGGVGVALRLYAEQATVASGGSVTSWEPGDVVPSDGGTI